MKKHRMKVFLGFFLLIIAFSLGYLLHLNRDEKNLQLYSVIYTKGLDLTVSNIKISSNGDEYAVVSTPTAISRNPKIQSIDLALVKDDKVLYDYHNNFGYDEKGKMQVIPGSDQTELHNKPIREGTCRLKDGDHITARLTVHDQSGKHKTTKSSVVLKNVLKR